MTLSYVISGFIVGILVCLIGVGGGSLMTSLLTLFFNIHPSIAVGTDLAFAATTKTIGTLFAHRFKRTVRWDIIRCLCYGALPAAAITTLFLKYFCILSNSIIALIILYAIAISVLLTVIVLLFQAQLKA